MIDRLAKIKTILAHVIFWVLFFSLPFLLRPDFPDVPEKQMQQTSEPPLHFLVICLMNMALFYLNAYYVFPQTVKKKQYAKLFLYQTLICGFILFVFSWMFTLSDTNKSFPKTFPFFLYAVTTIIAFSYYLLNDKIETDRELAEKEKEYLRAELQFLRWQISPHFLFNVLNNMAALSRLKSDQLEPTIIRLSGLMRYMLYDSEEKRHDLTEEIEYINNYISLQNLRFGDKIDISLLVDIDETLFFDIEPMLLIPFVENAFKHGVSDITEPFIKISISLKKSVHGGSIFLFEVKNKYKKSSNNEHTLGIGMNNVKRRINLLYKKKGNIVDNKIDQMMDVHDEHQTMLSQKIINILEKVLNVKS